MSYLELAKKVVTERCIATSTQPVSFETLEGLFREVLDALNREYLDGCLDYVARVRPGLLHEAHEAERRLDQVWEDTTAGKATLEEFGTALETWHGAYLACFEVYNKRLQ